MNCSAPKSKAVTTALTCSRRRLAMTAFKRHTESMGCEFMFERDPCAFTVNNLSATLSMKKLTTKMETVRDKRKNGPVDKNGRAQQDFQHHKQGRTGLERCCECNRSMASDTLTRRASMIHAHLVFSRSVLCAAGLRVHIGNFARHGGFQRHFQLIARIVRGVFQLHVVRIDVISASQLSCIDELRLFNGPMLFFLLLSAFRPA